MKQIIVLMLLTVLLMGSDSSFYVNFSQMYGSGSVETTLVDTVLDKSYATGRYDINTSRKNIYSIGLGHPDGLSIGLVMAQYDYDGLKHNAYGVELDNKLSILYETYNFQVSPFIGARALYGSIDNITTSNNSAHGLYVNFFLCISELLYYMVDVYAALEYDYGVFDTGDNSDSRYTTNAHFSTKGFSFGARFYFNAHKDVSPTF